MAEVDNHVEPENNPLAAIDERLSTLKAFETEARPTTGKSIEVDNARDLVRWAVKSEIDFYNRNRIVVSLHGSLQYFDPNNLDLDLTFLTDDPQITANNDVLRSSRGVITTVIEASKGWPRNPLVTDFGVANVALIEETLPLFEGQEFDPEIDQHSHANNAGYVLSSVLVVDDNQRQQELLAEFQGKVRELALKSDWLREGIIENLDAAIADRRERRGIISEE